ncbi:NMD5 [[Candida] subhashii]|uniref:NMD5 n=1 Tax=[Candida] subhashii TaxID=561895 RepID=A0A8J5QP70_9ASCO|nr:NMD5 [[Candida] subhashii]KAG7665139.1 NMD5 [[Candida] subhashii]
MDANLIIQCLAGTLQPSHEIRVQAETKLREFCQTPGFLGACLDILISDIAPELKKATAVYFKNRIIRFWNAKDGIDNDERPIIKDRIIPVIISVEYSVKQQLIPVLRILIACEFEKWDGLLNTTGELLQSNNKEGVYTGMLCFSEIARKFKWVPNSDRKNLDSIISTVFPHLLTIGNSIISSPEEMTEFDAEIVKLILKAYKFVTYHDLPQSLQSKPSVLAWGEFHASVINMPPPSYVTNSSMSEQEKSFLQISKCYKWSIANLYRLFTRYASRTISQKFRYTEFHDLFLNEFIPHFINNFLNIIEQYCQGTRWLSTTALYQLLEFLSHCIVEKSTWLLIKPYYETLLTHLIFPLLCPNDELLETFEIDPVEYINLCFDPTQEYDSPEAAALALLATLVYKRKKTTLTPIITFIHQQLTALQSQEENLDIAKKKEGVFRMLGSISTDLINVQSEYRDQMEPFIQALVIPSLNSKFEFLQARAIEILGQFADIEFKDEQTLSAIFHGILKNFDKPENEDVSIVVLFESAIAIQSFMIHDEFKKVLSGIILPTMSKLLELSNEIDNDAISTVMQECVENFSEQLQPFGVDLMTKLVSQVMRLAREINEASLVDVDNFDGIDDQGDKVMAALGILNTMITVLLSFENSRDICLKLEEIFSEVIEFVLVNEQDDFLAEIGELIENSTFLMRSVSEVMWKNFRLLYLSFEKGLSLMYVEELKPCLLNFLIYGKEDLKNHDELAEMFFKIFELIVGSEDMAYNELIDAFELAQTFILCLEQKSIPYIPAFVKTVLEHYNTQDEHNSKSSLFINCNNVLISSLIYDSMTTTMLLQQSDKFITFLHNWFLSIPELERVFDLKLSVLGLMNLSMLEFDDATIKQVSQNLIILLKKLPVAIDNLEKKRKKFDELDSSAQADADYEGIWQYELGEEDEDDDVTNADQQPEETEKYINFLTNEDLKLKSNGYFDEADEELFEDPLVATALDSLNIFLTVQGYVNGLKNNNGNRFNLMFGDLNEDDQKILIDIMEVN